MVSEITRNNVKSQLLKYESNYNAIGGAARVMPSLMREQWENIILEVAGVQCIPFLLWWNGDLFAETDSGTIIIIPEWCEIDTTDSTIATIVTDYIEVDINKEEDEGIKEIYSTFYEWRNLSANNVLSLNEVAGYKHSLSLGGEESIHNQEKIDAEVYFTMTWQIASSVL